MFKHDAVHRYRVEPGSAVILGDTDADEKILFEGKKRDSLGVLGDLRLQLKELQNRLYAEGKQSLLVVIQAMDTGGKDGCVKSVFASVDPKGIEVVSFKKPSEAELAYDFLWRVHKKVPRKGQIGVFNRSHYEDILAVRVKKIFAEEVWQRRYRHIVEFERMLADEGTKIVKIFLRISKEEQKERLQARLNDPAKHWKFNPNDLLDRTRWEQFMNAYEDLIAKTSTEYAPWYVVPANRKWYRNLVVTQIINNSLCAMNPSYPKVSWNPDEMKIMD